MDGGSALAGRLSIPLGVAERLYFEPCHLLLEISAGGGEQIVTSLMNVFFKSYKL